MLTELNSKVSLYVLEWDEQPQRIHVNPEPLTTALFFSRCRHVYRTFLLKYSDFFQLFLKKVCFWDIIIDKNDFIDSSD